MRTRTAQHHPAFASVLSACGRVSGTLTPPLVACVAPPPVRTKARFMPVHRLCTWADRVLPLSPPGGAQRGSMVAQLRATLDDLPTCQALIQRVRRDAGALLACPPRRTTQGLSPDTRAPCDPLIDVLPTPAIRRACPAALAPQLATATP